MDGPKILIADTNEDIRCTLADLLSQRYSVKTCASGSTARELLRSFRPDILVLELMLPEVDGLFIIEEVVSMPNPPPIIVITRQDNGYVRQKITTLQVVKMMRKPCDLIRVEASIREIAQHIQAPPSESIRAQVSEILLDLGFQSHREGFDLLKYVIPLYLQDPSQPIFKVIYRQAGTLCGKDCSSSSVDKAIREAIKAGWSPDVHDRWLQLFPQNADKAPTNKVFVARLAELIKNGK